MLIDLNSESVASARVDGREKVSGTARYASEYTAPELVHAVLLQSTIARGHIVELDTTAAEDAPGSLFILTHRNCPPLQHLPEEYTSVFPGERRTPLQDNVIH